MLVYESEIVAEVAELTIVADSGVESIKATASWRRIEARTIVQSAMNNTNGSNGNNNTDNGNGHDNGDEKALVATTNQNNNTEQSNTKTIPSVPVNKKPKIKGKKPTKHAMIQCKTFVFKPSNNGVINFGYKGLFDEKVMNEADRVFKEEKAKEAKEDDDVKRAEVVVDDSITNVKDNNTTADTDTDDDGDDESDQRKRNQPAKLDSMSNSKIVVESKDFDPVAIKEQLKQDQHVRETQEVHKNPKPQERNDEQIASRKISVPRRRSRVPPSLPTIQEETEAELDAAERERWFIEDFCCGVLPPPEELDDWSEPAAPVAALEVAPCPKLPADEEKILREKMLELQKLGFKRVVDDKGNKIVTMTPEARAKFLQTKEFRDYAKKMKELEKQMGREAFERNMKIAIVTGDAAAMEPAVKQPSPLASSSVSIESMDIATSKAASAVTPPGTPKTETFGYLSSAGVLETPIKTKSVELRKKNEEELRKKKEEEQRKKEEEELRREKDVNVASEDDTTKPGPSRKQPKVDLSSFKRRRI